MSEANLTKVLYTPMTFDVQPSAQLREVRFISSGLDHEKLTVMSEEIRADRARSQLIKVGENAAGPLGMEFIVGENNYWTLSALQDEQWREGADIVIADSALGTGVITITATAGTFGAALQGAKYVRLTQSSGSPHAAYNGIKRLISASDTQLVIERPSGAIPLMSGVTLSVAYKYARNGRTKHYSMIEHQYLGLATPAYAQFMSQLVDQWTLTMDAQARIMQTFQFSGTNAVLGAATAGVGEPMAHSTRPICNTTGNVSGLVLNDGLLVAPVLSMNFTLGNNLRNRPALGRETTLIHGTGRSAPDGTLNAYFDDTDLLEKFLNHESVALMVPIMDAQGNLQSVFMPHIEFADGWPTIDGIDTDLMLNEAFNATAHPTLGYAIQVDQLDAVAEESAS